MKRFLAVLAASVVAVAALASVAGAAPPVSPGTPAGQGNPGEVAPPSPSTDHAPVCPGPAAPDTARCHAQVVTEPDRVTPKVASSPYGLSPAQIKAAYNWGSIGDGAGVTIAIVDAYDDPTALNDLNVFSQTYQLPQPCAAVNNAPGCFSFTKVNQNGVAGSYPRRDAGWALEISLDIQWAHAIAPKANIVLVEASSNSFANLLKAEDWATAHASSVSNSWGGSEFSTETAATYDGHFNRANVSIFVAAGDSGLPAEYPSASPYVVSVGGTTLTFNANGSLASETGWGGGGGGCSRYELATAAQSGFAGYPAVSCAGKRATPDMSADADPSSGVSVYDTTPYQGATGWWRVGGTSASTPILAARTAVSGLTMTPSTIYGSSVVYRDITSGNNGAPCLVGFDLCSGRGSWLG